MCTPGFTGELGGHADPPLRANTVLFVIPFSDPIKAGGQT